MSDFTPVSALIGGAIIGLAASLLLLANGRVAGISGLLAGLVRPGAPDRGTRGPFILGLVVTGLVLRWVRPEVFATAWSAPAWIAVVAGVLVGVGTQLGSGCTSGHGVCGISRLSARSMVATAVFMATGMATVLVVRHVLGGGS